MIYRTVFETLAKFHAPSYLLLKEETQSDKPSSIESFLDKHPCLKDCLLFDAAAKHLQGWFDVTFQTAGLVLEVRNVWLNLRFHHYN